MLRSVVRLWDPRYLDGSPRNAIPSGVLPDPTALSSRTRSRGVHALAEQPGTGDLFALTGDSKINVLRPSAAMTPEDLTWTEAIQPVQCTHPDLRSNFWMGLSFSPCGRYLASGSSKGGVMTWDTGDSSSVQRHGVRQVMATNLQLSNDGRDREVSAVDWGYDMVRSLRCTLATSDR